MSLKVFITGGTSGLGLALARKFQSEGHQVGICGRDLSKIESETFEKIKADVTSLSEMKNAVDFFEAKYGEIDIMIANAGIAYANKSKIPDFEYSRKMIDINIYGLLNTVEAVLPQMVKRRSGHLVTVSSVAGFNGLPGVSCYAASKGFSRLMFETFAIDLKDFGISTSIVIPAWMDTPLARVNPHPMPMLITAERAAEITYKAIIKKKYIIAFPKRMYFIVKVLSYLPRGFLAKLFTLKFLNFSRKS